MCAETLTVGCHRQLRLCKLKNKKTYIGSRFKTSRETLHMAIRYGVNTQRSVDYLVLSPCSAQIACTLGYPQLQAPEYYAQAFFSWRPQAIQDSFFTLSYRVSKVLSKVVVDIVLSTYSGDRMPTKRLKPSSYHICCGLRLMPHQMT